MLRSLIGMAAALAVLASTGATLPARAGDTTRFVARCESGPSVIPHRKDQPFDRNSPANIAAQKSVCACIAAKVARPINTEQMDQVIGHWNSGGGPGAGDNITRDTAMVFNDAILACTMKYLEPLMRAR